MTKRKNDQIKRKAKHPITPISRTRIRIRRMWIIVMAVGMILILAFLYLPTRSTVFMDANGVDAAVTWVEDRR